VRSHAPWRLELRVQNRTLNAARAAIAGRDYPDPVKPAKARSASPFAKTLWAQRPLVTPTGQRLLALRVTDEQSLEVLVAGSPSRWVAAERVLSAGAVRDWLAHGFGGRIKA
jgi:hypothetical protein